MPHSNRAASNMNLTPPVTPIQNVASPSPFLQLPGAPHIIWKRWFRAFHAYIMASGGKHFDSERKYYLLYNLLGTEGQRIFDHLSCTDPNLDEYESAISKLQKHFDKEQNIVFERHKFYNRYQRYDEPIEQYLADLQVLASTCAFETISPEQIIRDQIIIRMSNTDIQKKLLALKNPTLDKVIETTKAMELTAKCQQAIRPKTINTYEQTNVVNNNKFKKQSQTPHSKTCLRCGSFSHSSSAKSCPAWGTTCHACGKQDHFSRVCMSKAKGSIKEINITESTDEPEEIDNYDIKIVNHLILGIEFIGSDDEDSDDCHTLSTNNVEATQPLCVMEINGVPCEFLIDSGSTITLVSKSWMDTSMPNVVLTKTNIRPKAYGGMDIFLYGFFVAPVTFEGKSISCKIYVTNKGACIFGWLQQKRMGLILDPAGSKQIYICNNVVTCDNVNIHDDMVKKFPKVFENRLGLLKGMECEIVLVDGAIPVKHKPRPVPVNMKDEVMLELEKLKKGGIIEPIERAQWLAPLAFARKKTGEVRVCVNLRSLNNNILVDCHPLPRVQDLISDLAGASVFSTLDLRSAYHQIRMKETSKHLTAFVTPMGAFQFCRMPFGLASAASIFQKAMFILFKGMKGVVAYQDDILVFGETLEVHNTRLEGVLEILQSNGLTLKEEKCEFAKNSVQYLGHDISDKGVVPKFDTLQAIKLAPSPKDKEQLLSFIGLCEYYSRFIPMFAHKMEPLLALNRKGQKFVWSDECNDAFNGIKEELVNARALQSYECGKKTILTVDASMHGLGAVLTQMDELGRESTIAFASRTLSPCERKYAVIEREALACTWAIEKFKYYIWGIHFVLRSDHKPLIYVVQVEGQDKISSRLARIVSKLNEWHFTMEYIQGGKNKVADCLSRLPIERVAEDYDRREEDYMVTFCDISHITEITEEMWWAHDKEDECLTMVKRLVVQGWPGEKELSLGVRPYWKIRHELSVENGFLTRSSLIVPPDGVRIFVVREAHSGHLGRTATKRRVRDKFWWPSMDQQVECLIDNCVECMNADKTFKLHKEPLVAVKVPSGPWIKLGLDIMGPCELLSREKKFIFVLTDYYSKWVEFKFAGEASTRLVLGFLTEVFSREGLPKQIVTDNGVQFMSSDMKCFLEKNAILHVRIPLYSPRTNGQVERMNGIIKNAIQLAIANKVSVDQTLRDLFWSYHTTPHSVTGFSPFTVMRGREAGTRMFPVWLREKASLQTVPLCDAHLRDRVQGKQEYMVSYYNRKNNVSQPELCVGDVVKAKIPFMVKKGQSKFGEWLKVERLSTGAALLSDGRWRKRDDLILKNKKSIPPFPRNDNNLPLK